VIVELITFLLMMAILARYVYPEIVRLAEASAASGSSSSCKDAEKCSHCG